MNTLYAAVACMLSLIVGLDIAVFKLPEHFSNAVCLFALISIGPAIMCIAACLLMIFTNSNDERTGH